MLVQQCHSRKGNLKMLSDKTAQVVADACHDVLSHGIGKSTLELMESQNELCSQR